MLSANRMLGPFCVSTTSKDRFASARPSMHRDTVNHSPDSPAAKRGRGTARQRGGRGFARSEGSRKLKNGIRDIIDAAHQLAYADPYDGYALPLKPTVTARVELRPLAHIVAHPVDLDREPRFRAIEIKNVRPHRMLTPKHW